MRLTERPRLAFLALACTAGIIGAADVPRTLPPPVKGGKPPVAADDPRAEVKKPGATLSNWKIARVYELDGATDHVRVEDHRELRVQALTVAAWVNTADADLIQPIVAKVQDTGNWNSYILRIQDGGKVLICVEGVKANYEAVHFVTTRPVITSKKWYHVAATWTPGQGDATDAKVYIDGVEQPVEITLNANYGPKFKIFYTDGPLLIGRDQHPTGHFKGTIKDVQVLGRVLTAAEVKRLAGK